MKGKLFEDFMNRLLVGIGFNEVMADGETIYMGVAGKMIQGLAESHNADVLVEPSIQTPFYFPTRLLVECKDYDKKIGLNVIRSALGLRIDINNFEILDQDMLDRRRANNRGEMLFSNVERYNYQVAVASTNGFSTQAQEFAYVHKIPLIDLKIEVFKDRLLDYFAKIEKQYKGVRFEDIQKYINNEYVDIPNPDLLDEYRRVVNKICKESCVGITNSGDIIVMHRVQKYYNDYCGLDFTQPSRFRLYWDKSSVKNGVWVLEYRGDKFAFMLPEDIFNTWLDKATDPDNLRQSAIRSKEKYFEKIVVYYRDDDKNPHIQVLNIDKKALEEAKSKL